MWECPICRYKNDNAALDCLCGYDLRTGIKAEKLKEHNNKETVVTKIIDWIVPLIGVLLFFIIIGGGILLIIWTISRGGPIDSISDKIEDPNLRRSFSIGAGSIVFIFLSRLLRSQPESKYIFLIGGNHSVTGASSTARFGFYSLNQDGFFFLGGGISLWNKRGKGSRVIFIDS